jgi:hypothetical protein
LLGDPHQAVVLADPLGGQGSDQVRRDRARSSAATIRQGHVSAGSP